MFSFCDFTGAKKKNKYRAYKTYTGYNFSVANIDTTFKKAFKYYKKLIKNGEYLFSFEKELLKYSNKLQQEYKIISNKLNEYSGKQFFQGVPLSLIETIESINCNLKIDDKTSLDYRIARLTVLSGFYYISLYFSGGLESERGFFNYRNSRTDAAFFETEKLIIKKFYSLMDSNPNPKEENSLYKIKAEQRKNYLFTETSGLIADGLGNFAYQRDGKCVCEFGKFNFIKHFNFKINDAFFTDKFCVYKNDIDNDIKICLDINGDIVLTTNFSGTKKIYFLKILNNSLKFVEKTNYLHCNLASEKCGEVIPYRLSGLAYSSEVFDTGIMGSCFNHAFKGLLKGFSYDNLFKNVKVVTILIPEKDNFEAEKILKFVKIFNKFNYGFYVVLISDFHFDDVNERFKKEELNDEKISFLKKRSTLFFDGKKIKTKINFLAKSKADKLFNKEPFIKIKNTRLKELTEILYSVPIKTSDSVFEYCLKNISDMSYANRVQHRQNILSLFKMQTLEGLLPCRFKSCFADYKGTGGLLSGIYYVLCFLNKYNERDILKETVRYSIFSSNSFTLEESKIYDTLEYHLLAGIQYILNSEEEDLKTEIFKLFILKKIPTLVTDSKIKKNIFGHIGVLTKKLLENQKIESDKFLLNFFDYINLNIKKDSNERGLSGIIRLFENISLKSFERAVLDLVSIKEENEKFLSIFLLKQVLTEKILGVKFHKNLVSFNPSLPEEIKGVNLQINKTFLKIGYFGYSGVEIKGRKYYNYNYINLESDGENIVSIG